MVYNNACEVKPSIEKSNSFPCIPLDSLKEYHRVNNALPEKSKTRKYSIEDNSWNLSLVVLYRDGVSDGQLAIVAEHELPQIIDTFPKIMPGYQSVEFSRIHPLTNFI